MLWITKTCRTAIETHPPRCDVIIERPSEAQDKEKKLKNISISADSISASQLNQKGKKISLSQKMNGTILYGFILLLNP